MLTISTPILTLTCDETGRGLTLHDCRRGAAWALDEASVLYATADSVAPEARRALVPAGARLVTPDTLAVTWRAAEVAIEVTYRVTDDYVEVTLPALDSAEIQAVTLPGSFAPVGEPLRLLLPIMQGMLWDGRGPAHEAVREEAHHLGFSMAFIGYLGERGGLLAAPVTRDDVLWWFGKEQTGRFWATNAQISSLGTLRYPRVLRLYPTDADIVAVAKRYRRLVREAGGLRTWADKLVERPALERLFGALMCFVGYCQDDLDYAAECRKLRDYGFDRALIYPARFNMFDPDIRMGGQPPIALSRAQVAAITALGYDVAPWSWINEALDDGSPRIQRLYRRNAAGTIMPHWRIDDQQWYLTCYSLLEAEQRAALAGPMADMTWDHFDVLACVAGLECYATNHAAHPGRPLTRAENRAGARRVFGADRERGLIVSSENFNDAFAADYDLGSVKAWPQYGPWPFWPVPLTGLVYHDCLIHSWWELHSYNNDWSGKTRWPAPWFEYGGGRPRLQAAMDALYGCPPDVFPFGAQYGWTGRGTESFLFKYRFEDPEVQLALRAALPVARLHRRIGPQEMVHFKILSEDGYVQETAYADGTRIVANFSRDVVGSTGGLAQAVVSGVDSLMGESWVEMG
jgi:hypothetical protein